MINLQLALMDLDGVAYFKGTIVAIDLVPSKTFVSRNNHIVGKIIDFDGDRIALDISTQYNQKTYTTPLSEVESIKREETK